MNAKPAQSLDVDIICLQFDKKFRSNVYGNVSIAKSSISEIFFSP